MKVGILVIVFSLAFGACRTAAPEVAVPDRPSQPTALPAPEEYNRLRTALEPFFTRRGKPEPGEWLATYPEPGQTFEDYINATPTLPTDARRTIYIRPIGKFDKRARAVVLQTSRYMAVFFGIPVKVLAEGDFQWPLSLEDYRINKSTKSRQVRTGYILHEVLEPELPEDAAALIAFTTEDLYPDETMNFVFGQASLEKRVGVWSLSRLADDDGRIFLKRTLQIGMHETGHMFSMQHCTKYHCVMSGSNSLGESDREPLDACPECTAKICWMTKLDPAARFGKLAKLTAELGLGDESDLFAQKSKAVGGP